MPDPTPPEGEQNQEAPKPSAQDRINRLTRQKHDATREVEALTGQVESLTAQVARLTQAPAPVPPAPAPAPISPFGTPQQAQPPVAPAGALTDEQLTAKVTQAVQAAIAPVTQAISANQRSVSHQQTFSELAREEPSLADPNSDMGKAFAQIWDSSPELQALDNGLELAVFAARGAVGSTPAVPSDAAKTAAAVTPPRTSPQNLLPADVDDVSKAKELAGALIEKGSQGGLSEGEWEAMLAAKLGAQTPQ